MGFLLPLIRLRDEGAAFTTPDFPRSLPVLGQDIIDDAPVLTAWIEASFSVPLLHIDHLFRAFAFHETFLLLKSI
jgi:hypothetical protein